MKRATSLLFALILSLGLSGFALAQDDSSPAPKGEKAFKMYDANGDGKITKEEYVAAAQKRAEARFAKLDKDNKGYLTKDDFMAAREKMRERFKNRKAKASAPATPQ